MARQRHEFAFQYDPREISGQTRYQMILIFWLRTVLRYYILIKGKGCRHILKEIWRVKTTLVVFGHIHEGLGEDIAMFDHFQACYKNVHLGVQTWSNLARLLLHTISRLVVQQRSTVGNVSTHLINAAIMSDREIVIAYVWFSSLCLRCFTTTINSSFLIF